MERNFKVSESCINLKEWDLNSPIEELCARKEVVNVYTTLGIPDDRDISILNKLGKVNLILEVNYIENIEQSIVLFLDYINKDRNKDNKIKLKTILFSSDCSFNSKNLKYLKLRIPLLSDEKSGGVNIGLKVEIGADVEKIKSILEFIPISSIATTICPLYFDYKLYKLITEDFNIPNIIGINFYGNEDSRQLVINSFSKDYLIKFVSTYADYVSITNIKEESLISSLQGQESLPMFELKRTVNKLVKPLKKAVWNYLEISNNFIIESNNPNIISPEIKLSLGKKDEVIPGNPDHRDELEIEIEDLLQEIKVPSDARKSKDVESFIFFNIKRYIEEVLTDVIVDYSIVSDNLIFITKKKVVNIDMPFWKRLFCKTTKLEDDSKYALAFFSSGEIVFRRIKQA